MRLSSEKLKNLCSRRRLSLGELLSQAGVSRTAYYSLARKGDILPKSLRSISGRLGVPASAFLVEEGDLLRSAMRLNRRVDEIARRHRGIDREEIRHTLILLRMKPIDRLERALLRAQALHSH